MKNSNFLTMFQLKNGKVVEEKLESDYSEIKSFNNPDLKNTIRLREY